MEKRIDFTPAYDKRNSDPNKNYGIHGMDMRFVLKGELGATQFVIFTNWYLEHVAKELEHKPTWMFRPMGADVGYHSPKPIHNGQTSMGSCEYLDGKDCYYGGSGLRAETLLIEFIKNGVDVVWKELEDTYVDRFGELK